MPTVLPIKREPRKDFELSLDEIAREGARRLLVQALNLEVADYIEQFNEEVDESGKRLVVRNGIGRARKITMGSGAVEVQCPRVNDRRDGEKFLLSILPPCGAKMRIVAAFERNAISSPVAGAAIYQTDNRPGLRVYNGTNWMRYTETAD